jgi:hypothetical protein
MQQLKTSRSLQFLAFSNCQHCAKFVLSLIQSAQFNKVHAASVNLLPLLECDCDCEFVEKSTFGSVHKGPKMSSVGSGSSNGMSSQGGAPSFLSDRSECAER